MGRSYKASIIIPAYNEENGIVKVIEDVKSLNENYEIIVVDDKSTDKTFEIVRKNGVKVISHAYNKGYGAALKSGIRNASADILIFMDGDGQHKARDIQLLLQHMEDYDMVVGARTQHSYFQLFRKPGKKILTLVANYLSGMKIPDLNSGFRAIRKKRVLEFMHILPNGFSFSTTITLALLKASYNVKYVPITTMKRCSGNSTVNQYRDGAQTILLIIRAIVLFNPLKVFVPMALLLFAFGLLFSIYGVIRFHSVPGTGIITVLSGLIIFFFGIIADQISAMRREGK